MRRGLVTLLNLYRVFILAKKGDNNKTGMVW